MTAKQEAVRRTLQDPTAEEKGKPVYDRSGIKIYPHALTEYVFSCPQHAVFRIESSQGVRSYMAISSNRFVCRFSPSWQEVFNNFLLFARANRLTVNDLALASFFKDGSRKYDRGSMETSFDLLGFVQEIRPLSALTQALLEVHPGRPNGARLNGR